MKEIPLSVFCSIRKVMLIKMVFIINIGNIVPVLDKIKTVYPGGKPFLFMG